jgi:hypothetical protein
VIVAQAIPKRTQAPGDHFGQHLRSLPKARLYDLLDEWCARASAAERSSDPDGVAFADRRYDDVWDEIDRRNAGGRQERRREAAP